MGRSIRDPSIRRHMEGDEWPFNVVVHSENTSRIAVEVDDVEYDPEFLSSIILSTLKRSAEAELACAVKRAVVTVPHGFGDAQIEATKDAAEIAGFTQEPTAAAMAYAHELDPGAESTVVVYDLGGGTFDVTVFSVEVPSRDDTDASAVTIDVLSTDGDMDLGGQDFTRSLLAHVMARIKTELGVDLAELSDRRAVSDRAVLLTECEKVKRELSSSTTATVHYTPQIRTLSPEPMKFVITRAEYVGLIDGFLDKTMSTVSSALAEARKKDPDLTAKSVDMVILVGGSSRTPAVSARLEAMFGKALHMTLNPDEAVAVGAAIHAANLHPDAPVPIVLNDVVPLPIGIHAQGDVFSEIIPRNSPIPVSKRRQFHAARDGQTGATVRAFQGFHRTTAHADMIEILKFDIDGLKPTPNNAKIVEVEMSVGSSGLLTVEAIDSTGNHRSETRTTTFRSRAMSRARIAQLQASAEAHEAVAALRRKARVRRADLESLIRRTKANLPADPSTLPAALTAAEPAVQPSSSLEAIEAAITALTAARGAAGL